MLTIILPVVEPIIPYFVLFHALVASILAYIATLASEYIEKTEGNEPCV